MANLVPRPRTGQKIACTSADSGHSDYIIDIGLDTKALP
jgi:hypothetical protein